MAEVVQSASKPAARSARKRPFRWLAAWVLLTAGGTLVHHVLWNAGGGLDAPTAAPSLARGIGNILHMLTAFGWVVLRITARDWPMGSWGGPVVANAMGWAAWLIAFRAFLRIRRAALRWDGRSRAPAPVRVIGVPDSSRRRFLVETPWALAAAGGAAALVDGVFIEPWQFVTRSYRLRIQGLPAGLDGLRAVQLSDTHLGPRIHAAYIKSAVERAIALRPDLFLLTGDYIHNGPAFIEPAAELFRPLIATGLPVIGVLGNHDWYSDGRAVSRAMDAIGVRMIDNRRIWLDEGTRQVSLDQPRGGALCIAGVGDLLTHYVDMAAALAGVREEMPRVLLAHNPDTAELAIDRGPGHRVSRRVVTLAGQGMRVDLMLSGHTHGGQVRIPLLGTPAIPSRFGQKYAGGVVQGPRWPVVVSRGVGMSILPIRLGVPPELVEVTLVRA